MLILDPTGKPENLGPVADRVPAAIILTHGHFDHIGAVDELVRQFTCKVYVHPADQVLLEDETLNGMAGMTAHVRTQTTPLMEGTMKLGQIELQILEAPGHTPGSVLIVIGQDCFCGDVVFEGSVGRTDLPLGNDSQMRQTLKMIRMLNPQLNLYPAYEVLQLGKRIKRQSLPADSPLIKLNKRCAQRPALFLIDQENGRGKRSGKSL